VGEMMKTNSVTKTIGSEDLYFDSEPAKIKERPADISEPGLLKKPSVKRRKKEASRPLYLVRYE
jgi:hypothetical protein